MLLAQLSLLLQLQQPCVSFSGNYLILVIQLMGLPPLSSGDLA